MTDNKIWLGLQTFAIPVQPVAGNTHSYDADDLATEEWLKNNNTNAQLVPFSITKKINGQGAYLEEPLYLKFDRMETCEDCK